MNSKDKMSQGQYSVTDPETGRSYIIPRGGAEDGDGDAGTVQNGNEGAQSGNSGQGFLEKYLADVPEDQRSVVEPVLEKYRADNDARVNKRFEELREETKVATAIHQSLLQDPINTLNWVADRLKEEQGIDARAELMNRWKEAVDSGQVPNPEDDPSNQQDPNKPLTQADIDKILEEREQQRLNQQKQEELSRQQAEEQHKTITGWIDGAAKSVGLELDDSQGEDPLRPVIIMKANELHESGVAKGQAAVELATESIAKRFGKSRGENKGGSEPKVATGGTTPPASDFDVTDSVQRKARMLEHFTSANS